MSLSQLLDAGRPDDHVIAARDATALTLGQLRAQSAQASRLLAARGTKRGLLVCSDSFQFLVGLSALLAAGADVVLPPNARPGTLASLAGAFDVLVTDEKQTEFANTVFLDGSGSAPGAVPFDSAQTRISFFTSGSTGQPKRIDKTLAMLEIEAATLDALWGATIGLSSVTGTVTHQHIYGLAFRVMWPLLSGRRFDATVYDTWESLLARLAANALIISSPAHLTRTAGLQAVEAARRPVMIVTAGGPLPASAAREVMEIFGVAPTEVFGSTETGALAFRCDSSEPALWQPMPGVSVSANAAGLLCVRSPYVAGGSCELADRAIVTEDGQFCFEGRADRIVKIEGRRVSLPQLERAMLQLRWVQDAAVATIPPDHAGLGAIVVLSAEGLVMLERHGKFRFERMLRRELANTHEPASLPRRWRFVSEIPADSMGKRRQRDLAPLLDAERPT